MLVSRKEAYLAALKLFLRLSRGEKTSLTSSGHVLFMCEASVQRYLKLFYTTGNVALKDHASGPEKMLGEFEQFTVLQTLNIGSAA